MLQAGWSGAWAQDMCGAYRYIQALVGVFLPVLFVYHKVDSGIGISAIPQVERERVGRVEMMDEYEEWNLMMSHYCLVWAWIDKSGEDQSPLSTITLKDLA